MVIWGVVGSVLARPNLIYHFWTFSQPKVARKLEKLPWECVFELSEPLLGPGIGLWGIVGSVLARPNQIYLYWTFSELRVARKLEKLPRKCVFELSEPLLGPGIGLCGIVGSVLARPNQIYLFWTFWNLGLPENRKNYPENVFLSSLSHFWGQVKACGVSEKAFYKKGHWKMNLWPDLHLLERAGNELIQNLWVEKWQI